MPKPRPTLINEPKDQDIDYKFELYENVNFENLENITQSYGLVVDDDNKILLVAKADKIRGLPGGTKEAGESNKETLIREIFEESGVLVDEQSIQEFFHQAVYFKENKTRNFECNQLRYLCKIKEKTEFTGDPDNKIFYQIYVTLEELDKYLKRGPTTKFIQEKLQKSSEQNLGLKPQG